jgi:hypothetical protein
MGGLGPLKSTKFFGFLSIDSSQPKAFDILFRGPAEKSEWQNEGENLTLGMDEDLYYGIADSAATILMLSENVPMSQKDGVIHG